MPMQVHVMILGLLLFTVLEGIVKNEELIFEIDLVNADPQPNTSWGLLK